MTFTQNRVTAILAVLYLAPAAGTLVLAAPPANSPAGSWMIVGTPEPHSGLSSFVNLANVTSDGQIVNVDPAHGTGVGSVARIAGQRYAVNFSGFLSGTPAVWRYVVNATVTLDAHGATFAGPFRTVFLDLTPLFELEGTIHATRE